MSDVRQCLKHGPHSGDECPKCGETGTRMLGADRRETLSRFLSYALRHDPGDAGIDVDGAGWATLDAVVHAAREEYGWPDETTVQAVVAADEKGRFEMDDCRIRAAYGHSINVDIDSGDGPVPPVLYHGTAPKNVPTILDEGLRPMNRQKVHLTDDVEEALDVGSRHAEEPVLLVVNARRLADDGQRVTKRGESVYTTDTVPPEFIA